MTSVCAVIAFRNEVQYLPTLLAYLREQGVDAFLLDNDSDDGSRDVIAHYRGAPVIGVMRLPFSGVFNLSAQLQAKEKLIAGLNHSWIIHQDADEILESNIESETLFELAARADQSGTDIIDFDEFVFLPDKAEGYPEGDYRGYGLSYYFFQPRPLRLNRMFKKASFVNFGNFGGHNITSGTNPVFETSHILRHYIVTNEAHAKTKYPERRFSENDLAKGWHGNRLNISTAALNLSNAKNGMARLEHATSRCFDRSNPRKTHFWEWQT